MYMYSIPISVMSLMIIVLWESKYSNPSLLENVKRRKARVDIETPVPIGLCPGAASC